MQKQQFNNLKIKYPIGSYIQLINMKDNLPVPPGTKGEILNIDDSGNLLVKWENNRTLRLIPEIDDFIII